jgi:hypothetical protein
VKIHEIGSSIRDHFYTAKVSKFLLSLNDIPAHEKDRIRDSIFSGRNEVQKLTEKILLVLETQSDIEKSEIIANLFLAYIDNKMTSSEFRRALDVTANSFLDELKEFLKGDGFHGFMLRTYEDLERAEIAGLVNSPLIGIDKTRPEELRRDGRADQVGILLYESTKFGSTYQSAYHYGQRLRRNKQKTEG